MSEQTENATAPLIEVKPEIEQKVRDAIFECAEEYYRFWGGNWRPGVDVAGIANPKIAGTVCADENQRLRQGGSQLFTIFSLTGHPHASRCRNISKEAVEMYARPHTDAERYALDIAPWSGLFALFIYKNAGLDSLPNWNDLKIFGQSQRDGEFLDASECHLQITDTPKVGDIGAFGLREVRNSDGHVIIPAGQDHYFIVTDVNADSVYSIDGNGGKFMEIVRHRYNVDDINKSGAFFTPIWENLQ